jgi:hypothetical protein
VDFVGDFFDELAAPFLVASTKLSSISDLTTVVLVVELTILVNG